MQYCLLVLVVQLQIYMAVFASVYNNASARNNINEFLPLKFERLTFLFNSAI